MNKHAISVAVLLSLTLSACGGGGGSGSSDPPTPPASIPPPASTPPAPTNESVGGIWIGTNTINGVTVKSLALVSETGEVFSIAVNESNDCADVATGTLMVTGDSFSGSAVAVLVSYQENTNIQTGCIFPDGSTYGFGTVSGTVAQRTTITLTSSFTTEAGTVLPTETGTLTFDSLYDETPSLSKLAGNWRGPTGVITTVNSDGSFYAQDPTTGCIVNGQYTIVNPNYNMYSGSATYEGCTGAATQLNGLTATGLMTLDDTVTPNQTEGGVTVRLGNGEIVIAMATAERD
jgi:hypothetical protein